MKLKTPVLIVNFKTYEEGTGTNALKLAKICEQVSLRSKKSIVIAVQPTDIFRIQSIVKIPVIAQHIDPVGFGMFTGSVTVAAVKGSDAVGTLINHSEKRMGIKDIKEAVKLAKADGLLTVVCSPSPEYNKQVVMFSPDFIAYEPPELIGRKISVSKAKPGLIKKAFDIVNNAKNKAKLIVGAVIHTKEDVAKSLELGAVGVLVASGVVKAKDPKKVLEDLVSVM